ncbi:DUF2723 domain-containing protein [Ignavibacteria bacterium CHB1]|nr:MAG: DUF2723 domain-containing protein [Chlorobiota bacterium]MBV6398504.1 hypothetical protein [Ignavibacteria bacterium]MCC6885738.1 DUF2723 domain-containing protein [Ignavibacteriales bacterium]MCE7953067.1 DUF2723 domain-containing protein [Chlorobi bacterium CHB7]MDL1887095.1 DUF2723 domain-containing protein [Ignavibacteria bacterium CHB1]RIK49885.1 MAG: hypothetical protein DCC60_02385 [Ignavibacteriota bacterium]
MQFRTTNKIFSIFAFLISVSVYVITVQPTFSLWDCGEFVASAVSLGNPHPPGAPFFILIGKIFTLLPLSTDYGLRMNYLSAFSSAGTVALVYLISTKIITNWKENVNSISDLLIVCGSSFIGALSLAFSSTFWFNALESEVYGLGTFLIALAVYFLMRWWESADESGSDRYLMLVAYIAGISIGIHLLVVQIIFIAGLMFYFRRYEYSLKGLVLAVILSTAMFLIVYPVLVIGLPQILNLNLWIGIVILSLLIAGIYYTSNSNRKIANLALISIFLIITGYSTYTMVILRAQVDNLSINENSPEDFNSLVSYLSREQYGNQPLFLPRRYSTEAMHWRTWENYSSDSEFLWKYQINEMFNRYLFWNFIGRAGYDQGAGVDISKLWAIPFLLGMLGCFYHFRRDWRLAIVFLIMFLLMGIITALYQNQQDPQPRERDYFYVGAFLVFSLWIGFGVAGIIEQISQYFKNRTSPIPLTVTILLICLLFSPLNMVRANYHYLDRSDNYVPFDYAYNILQSLEKDAILFTNGDNDTFTLWALQTAYGIRQDVRVVNLSLAQMPWYNLQLKNEKPFGSLPVPMTYSDAQLTKLRPLQWPESKPIKISVPMSAYPDTLSMKPGEINFEMPATISQQYNGQMITAVNSSDLIVLDILKANNWERPVYFCITLTSNNFIGLEDYLLLEGMAYRVVPFKVGSKSNIAINELVMNECLFNLTDKFYTHSARGFSFRGLNDRNIFFTEDQVRMIETYRTLYIKLSKHYAMNPETFEKANETLREMSSNISESMIPVDYRVKYDMAMTYYKIGETGMFNLYLPEIESDALAEINRNPLNSKGFYSPYRILVDLYETSSQYGKAIDVLNRMLLVEPGEPNITAKIEDLKSRLESDEN